jgi:hypothetical protein
MISFPFWTICVNFNSFSFRKEMDAPTANANNMTELEFLHRKKHIWSSLKRATGSPKAELVAIRGPGGDATLESGEMAELLSNHWQHVFDPKHSQANARQNWFDHIHYDVNLAALSLPPSKECVATLVKNLPISAAGPDGIPFGLYAALKDLALPIFVHCLQLYLTAQVKHLLPSIMLFSFVCLRNLALIWTMESMHAGLVILDHCPLWMLQTVSSQFVY